MTFFLFSGPTLEFPSPLDQSGVVSALERRVANDFAFWDSRPLRGWIWEKSASVRVRIFYRNSFQTVMRVKFLSDTAGTRILCKPGVSWLTLGFMIFWFGFVITIGGTVGSISGVQVANGAPINDGHLVGILVPPAMIVFGAALYIGCRWLARHEDERIMLILRKALGNPNVGEFR